MWSARGSRGILRIIAWLWQLLCARAAPELLGVLKREMAPLILLLLLLLLGAAGQGGHSSTTGGRGGTTRLYPSATSPLQTPVQFTASTRHFVVGGAGLTQNWLAPPSLSWVPWVVVASTPPEAGGEGGYEIDTDAGRATFLRDFDPDVIDWTGGLSFNRADFARLRGVASSASYEFEYEESLQFTANETLSAFENDGMSRDEHNHPKVWGTHNGVTHYYMELNAPKWKETITQGNVRPAFFGDVVFQDNIGSPINKGLANFDDCSNARFVDWLARRCSATSCHPALDAVLNNASFNIRDHIASVRANKTAQAKLIVTRHVAMEPCGALTRAPHQDLQLTPGVSGQIKFKDGLCLTSRGAKSTNPGDTISQACSSQRDSNQIWTLEDGMLRSARTDCAGRSPCCLSIAGGRTAPGTALQLCGCSQLAHGCAGIDPAKAGLAMHLSPSSPGFDHLVSNSSGLCVTASVETNTLVPTHDPDYLAAEPVLHEFIRHGYISALQNWDDVAASVRSSPQPKLWTNGSARAGPTRAMSAVWGNQYGLAGGFPISTLMTQTSDVSWIEGVHSSGGALTYKIADASGDFTKPIFGDDYGKGRLSQAFTAEAYASGGVFVSPFLAKPPGGIDNATVQAAARLARFVSGNASRFLFVDRRRIADVALLFSIPSRFWRIFSSLKSSSNGGQPHFSSVSGVLENEHVSYETPILGHPDLGSLDIVSCMPTTGSPLTATAAERCWNRLDNYTTVVLSGADAISDFHTAHMKTWVQHGGHLLIVGNCTGALDEELKPRPGVNVTDPDALYMATTAQQPGRGKITRLSDTDLESLFRNQSLLASTIAPLDKRAVVFRGLPSTVHTSVFSHGKGPMASITFYRTEHDKCDLNLSVSVTVRLVAVLGQDWATRGDGDIEVHWHNLPLKTEAEPVATITNYETSADRASVTITLNSSYGCSIGALAVLTISSPGEAAARASAARLRKAKERLAISLRAANAPPSDTSFADDAEQLLRKVQCGGASHWWLTKPCFSYLETPPRSHPSLARELVAMAESLEARLAQTMLTTLNNQRDDRTAVLAAAKTATMAVDFGGQGAASVPAHWKAALATTAYTKARGYGFTSRTLINASAANPNVGAPFSDYLFGGTDGVVFAIDLPPGEYTVMAVVGSYDDNFKVAMTAVQDAHNVSSGMVGERVHAGIWTTRAMSVTIGHTGQLQLGQLQLRITGQAVGPQLSGVSVIGKGEHCRAEGFHNCSYFTPTSWLISALLVHAKSAASSLPSSARDSLALHDALANGAIRDWMVVGPFDDANSSGLWRTVSTADLSSVVPLSPCASVWFPHCNPLVQLNRTAVDLDASFDGKGAVVRWQRWRRPSGAYVVPVASFIDDDGWGSAAIMQTAIHCDESTELNVSFSTAGVGVLSIWAAPNPASSGRGGGPLLITGRDQVHAGLFDAEVSATVILPSGWSTLQLKTLSHFRGTRASWEAAASLLAKGAKRCRVDACGIQPNAAACHVAKLKSDDDGGPIERHTAVGCVGYLVTGAGTKSVNGCYKQVHASWCERDSGKYMFQLDVDHQLYAAEGHVWRIGRCGHSVAYLATNASALPPQSAEAWSTTSGTVGPCPAVHRSGLGPPPPPPPPTPPPIVYPPPPPMRLVFSDDFDGDALNESKWVAMLEDDTVHCERLGIATSYPGYVTDNVIVANGSLTLRVSKQNRTTNGTVHHFVSGAGVKMNASNFRQRYGRWEMRVKLPHKAISYTLHNSIWLIGGEPEPLGTWPNATGCSNEIDIVEQNAGGGGHNSMAGANVHAFSGRANATRCQQLNESFPCPGGSGGRGPIPDGTCKCLGTNSYQTLHPGWPAQPGRKAGPTGSTRTADFTNYFATWRLDWTEKWIAISINDTVYASYNADYPGNPDWVRDPAAALADEMILLLTAHAMSGAHGRCNNGALHPNDLIPINEYMVDWVRVYEWLPPPSVTSSTTTQGGEKSL
jgi:hypothetical protein